MKNIVYDKTTGDIVGIWSELMTVANTYPDNQEMQDKYNTIKCEDGLAELINYNKNKYKVEDGVVVEKTISIPSLTTQQKIDRIKAQYTYTLDNLILTKQRLEMLGQPTDSIVLAYQTKKLEMEEAIRNA